LWCGCSKIDNESVAPDDDARLIGVSASAIDVIASPSTRAPFTATAFSGQEVQVLATKTKHATEDKGDYGTDKIYCNGTMLFDGSDVTYYNTALYGLEGSKWYPDQGWVYLSGLYPYNHWKTESISNGVVSSHLLTGKEDLMYAGDVKSEMLGTTATLNFKHLLTLLNFNLATSLDKDVIVQKITLREIASSDKKKFNVYCKIDLNDTGTPPTFSYGNADANEWYYCFLASGSGESISYTGNEWEDKSINAKDNDDDVEGYVLAPPLAADKVTSSDPDYTLEVTYKINNDPYITRSAKINLLNDQNGNYDADTAGKSFNVTLNFDKVEITAKATIAEWTDGGTANSSVE
jgi:hypothetical protein